jgi:hypothetical protein
VALRKTRLTHDHRSDRWKLKDDATKRTIKAFDTKTEATAGGLLKRVLGPKGGSVRIEKETGTIRKSGLSAISRSENK